MQLTTDKKLVVRLPKWLGDAVACEPALRALDGFYRDAGRIENLTVAAPMRTIMLISHQHPGVQWLPTDRAPADRPAGWRPYDVALLFTGSSVIPKDAVLLKDDKALQPADNPVFVIKKDKANSATMKTLNAVSSKLTTAAYNKMSLDISEQKEDPSDVAEEFLEKNKLG